MKARRWIVVTVIALVGAGAWYLRPATGETTGANLFTYP